MNQSLVSRIYRLLVVAAVLAACIGVAGGAGRAQAGGPCLECRPQFSVTPGQTAVTAQAGQTVEIAIKLTNLNMLVQRHLYLTAAGSLPWPLALSSQDVLLQAGETVQVVLSVSVPPGLTDPPPGNSATDHITLKVTDNQSTITTDLYVMLQATQ